MQIKATYLLFLSLLGFCSAQPCERVTTVEGLDLEMYVSKRWYIHQQAVTEYSPIEWNYCTYAEYTIRDSTSFWGYKVDVMNYAEDVDGNQFGGPLCAAQNRREKGKLSVAPCAVPRWFAGPYWIVAYDEAEGYALISGGQPTIREEGGCRTGEGINNSGLWIFLRSKERDEDTIQKVRQIAKDQGFDLSVLNDVVQENCAYEDNNEGGDGDGDGDGDLTPVPVCEDRADQFRVVGIPVTCSYISRSPGTRCWFSRGNCPATCGCPEP
mmetsp:Transcript_31659/g.72714  ORF Transcript_31659/g.72714 Transcript_31659/m.72714 type:complete len:268 (-) Transcript_31659:53-856(-)